MMSKYQIVLVTSGEPSGIGPDICLDLVSLTSSNVILVILGDIELLRKRAEILAKQIKLRAISEQDLLSKNFNDLGPQELLVLNLKCANPNCLGDLKVENARYVLDLLDKAVSLCKQGVSSAIVTAPVNKEIINQSGYPFSGHTEYLAYHFNCEKVVMMLANANMKVALVTTHLPLKEVPKHITIANLEQTLTIIINSFSQQYHIAKPKIAVCGLNPHAGEGGFLGDEEINIINPVIEKWQLQGHSISGSYSADTIFNQAHEYDLILAMYHDQGLPVLKYSGFGSSINVTLGLPIIRVSVDHGTAIKLAGSGKASSQSLKHAVVFALQSLNNTTQTT